MTLLHAFDREKALQEFLAEIPTDSAHREKCKQNLQTVESAKGQATRKFKLEARNVFEAGQLSAFIPGGYESLVCPNAGTCTIGTLATPSRCSVHGTQMALGRR